MISGIVALTPVAVPELAGLPAQPSDPFAVLYAALAPVDAALPDAVSPVPDGMVDEEPATEADLSASAEDLLVLVAAAPAPLPLPVPVPMLVPAQPEQTVTAPRQTPKRGEAAPAREQPVRAVAPDHRDDAGERLLAVQSMPELDHAQGAPQFPPVTPGGKAAAAPAPPQQPPSPDILMEAAFPHMRDGSPAPARELSQTSTGRDPALPPIFTTQTGAPATPITPTPLSSMPVMAQHLAGQIAAALPRLRQSGGETVLTLDPARLGRVTLSWNPGESGGDVLTVRAVEPATAALLNRLGDDITAMLRAEPAMAAAGAAPSDLRLDIGRAERVLELRQAELANMMAPREFASDAGLSRHQQRAPSDNRDQHPQGIRGVAVNPDDSAEAARPQPIRVEGRARLA